MSNQTIFVTGTDTEIGKTYVSTMLIRAMVSRGLRVVGMKPVASGCVRTPQGLRNDDAVQLMAAANVEAPYEQVNPYTFEPAIAPHIAAGEAGVKIRLDEILKQHKSLSTQADWVVVEGVGGWQVPLGDGFTVADLAAGLGGAVVLVVGIRLGCINHALLSVESIVRRGLTLSGWIANLCDGGGERIQENIDTLTRMIEQPLIAEIPHAAAAPPGVEAQFRLEALGI